MTRQRLLFVSLTIALVVFVAACSGRLDLTNPKVIAEELPGTWSESFDVPGASMVFHLAVDGAAISGTGSYSIEAGPNGTLSITGAISGERVNIDFVRSDGLVGHFQATLKNRDTLSGSLFYQDPVPAEFRRTSR